MPYFPGNVLTTPPSSTSNTIIPTSSGATQITLKQMALTDTPVTWGSLTNCISSGNTITKNTGGNVFNSGGVTTQSIASGKNGYVTFSAVNLTDNIIIGFIQNSHKGNFASAAFDFGIFLGAGTGVYQFLDNEVFVTGGSYIVGDTFRVAETNNVITYFKNGTLIRTSVNSPTSYPLWGQADIATQGASISMTIVTDTSSSQSVDMFDIQDSSSNVLASIDNQGQFHATSGFVVGRKAVSASYSALATDYYIGYTSTASAFTVTLPAIASCPTGKQIIIKDESGGAATHNLTVKGNASETIDGSNTQVITVNYGSLTLCSNGTSWSIT